MKKISFDTKTGNILLDNIVIAPLGEIEFIEKSMKYKIELITTQTNTHIHNFSTFGTLNEFEFGVNFIFENIPRASGGEASMPIKGISAVWIDGWQFPLRVFVVPEEKTWVRFAFDSSRMSRADAAQLADSFHRNLIAIAAGANAPVSQLLGQITDDLAH